MLGSGRTSTPAEHITQGSDCVHYADIIGLRHLLEKVREKAATIGESRRLRQRIELLATFIEEAAVDAKSVAQREVSFSLYYFLKGVDLIPDAIPEIGLLDDSLMIEAAYNRNLLELRAQWAAQGRQWPAHV